MLVKIKYIDETNKYSCYNYLHRPYTIHRKLENTYSTFRQINNYYNFRYYSIFWIKLKTIRNKEREKLYDIYYICG